MQSLFKIILIGSGLSLVFILPFAFSKWPSVFRWQPYNPAYEHMIIAIYVAIGAFLIVASRKIPRYYEALWLIVWLNAAHGAAMAFDAALHPEMRFHLWGDVTLLVGWSLLLAIFLLKTRRPAQS